MTNAEMLEICQAFAVESAELLVEMEASLMDLETNRGDVDELNRLFRTIHTIKGSAGIVGYEKLEHFCHSIESILVQIRDNELHLESDLISLLLRCHDHIRSAIEKFCGASGNQDAVVLDDDSTLLDSLAAWSESPKPPGSSELQYDLLDSSYLGSDPGISAEYLGFNEKTSVRLGLGHENAVAGSIPVDSLVQNTRRFADQSQSAIRVDSTKLDQLSDLLVELVTASSVLETNVRRLGDKTCIESTDHVNGLIKQIQEKSMVFRMVPVQSLFRRFERIIHDIGKSNGKDIHLLISGGDTELDKAVAEKLYDPLLHLVRNAVDHGIESGPERTKGGKSATGTVHLQASNDSGNIVICIGDDGRGIDLERVAGKAAELGLLKQHVSFTESEVLNCIFEPGFSTLDSATTLSGRGVGMEVVKKAIDSLRGRIDIQTKPGAGTIFRINIPLSLSLIEGFMVSLGDSQFILPMELVQETLEMPDIRRPGVMTNGCLEVRDLPLPCLDLNKLLGMPKSCSGVRHVVVVENDGKRVGLIVDRLLGEVKAVVKPLGPLFQNVSLISGASILGDGNIALFLEMERLISSSTTT